MKNRWIRENEKTVLESPFVKLVSRVYRSSEDANNEQLFYVFRSRDWCNVFPVTRDGKVVLVKQFRIGVELHTDEIPGGVADPKDGDFQIAALRELTEETGYELAEDGRCIHIGSIFPNPAIQDNRQHFYLAGPVEKKRAQNLDSGEMIEVIEVPIEDIPAMIASGKITHGLHLAGFMLLAARNAQTSQALVEELRAFS